MSQAIATSGHPSSRTNRAREKIVARLHRFGRVRNRFDVLRGATTGLVFGLAFVWLIVLLDGTRWLSDPVRWGLILIGYAASFVVAWASGIGAVVKAWLFRLDPESLARDVEASCPHFRESLLASVGLRNADGSIKNGSEVFLNVIEQEAAEELRRLSMTSLFPWHELKNKLVLIAVGLATMLALCFVPSLHFPERLTRALLPLVDLAPISNLHIVLLTPRNHSETVPAEQYLSYQARIDSADGSSGLLQDVSLEWSEQSELEASGWSTPNRVSMSRESGKDLIYSVSAPVGTKKLRYRVIAADARTTYRYVEPIERPKVVEFQWNISPPAYTRNSDAAITEQINAQTQGDIAVLQGSALKLQLAVNQAMREVSIFLETDDGKKKTIAFLKSIIDSADSLAKEVWTAPIPDDGNARFQVHLTSTKELDGQPVVNSFRPWYNLKWLADAQPVVNWSVTSNSLWREPIRASSPSSRPSKLTSKTKSNYWVVGNTEIIELPCQIIDDYPIAKLAFEMAINDQPWQPLHTVESLNSSEVTISGKKLSGASSSYTWDLLPYQFKTTDQIQIRAVATDRAGQQGASETLSFSVAESELASDRYEKLLLRSQLSAPLRDLHNTWNGNRDAIRESINTIAKPEATEDAQRAAAKSIADWLSQLEEKLTRSEQIATSILPSLDSFIDQYDVELISKGVTKLKSEYLPRLQIALTNLQSSDQTNTLLNAASFEESRRRNLQTAEESLARGGELASQLFELQQDLTGLGLQSALTKDATYLMRLQAKTIATSRDQLTSVARSQLIVSKIAESILKTIQATRTDISKGLSERLDEWSRWLADSRGQISDLVEQNQTDAPNVLTEELKRRIDADAEEWKYRRWLFHLDGGLFWNTQSRRKDADFRTENVDESLSRMINVIEQLRRLDSNKELSSSELGAERSVLQQELKLSASIVNEHLRVRRELHQSRTIQDQNYPADLGLAKRALEYVLEQYRGASMQSSDAKQFEQHLRTILKSFRTLDAAHQIADARIGVERLMEAERYDFNSLAAQIDHNLHWNAVSQQIEVAYRKLQRANFPDGLHDRYNGLRWTGAFSQANQKFSSRMDPNSTDHASATPDLEELLQTWNAYDFKAKPFVEEARNALRKLVPSIPELAAEAIQKTKELERKTQELSKPTDTESGADESIADGSKEPSKTEEQLQSIAQSERSLAKATEQLQEALADEASRQDLLDSEARKRARDSDAALGMIERAQANLEQAMQSLATPESLTQESIADAIRAEKRMETTFQAIQERFSQEQKTSGQQESPESLAASKQDNSLSPNESNDSAESQSLTGSEMDPGYKKAEQLDALAKSSKEELLRDLEQQLKSDAVMRDELQAISETQQQSLSGELQSLGKSEKNASRELENSDPRMLESKRERTMEMRLLANYAERLGLRVMERAMQLESSSGQQRSPIDQRNKRDLQNSLAELQQSINQAGNLNEQTDAATLESANKNLESALQSALSSIKPIGDKLKEAADEPLTDPKTKKEAIKQAENYQKQFQREAKQTSSQLAQQWQREIQNQSQRFEQAKKELDQARNSRAQSQKNANQKPDDNWAQEELRRKTVDVDRMTQNLKALEQSIDQLKERSQQLDDKTKDLQETDSSSPAPNPTLGLAAEQIGKAQSLLEAVAEMAKETGNRTLGEPAASSETLSAATQRQKQINQAVDRIQDELQRSERHQERMEQTQMAKSLESYQNRVEQLKNETLSPLQSSLAEAATQTDAIEKKFSQENREADLSSSLEKPSSQSNIESLNEASNALKSLGESIENDATLASGQSEAATAGNSQNSREEMLQSRDRAQLLDRLDRMVFSRGSEGSESSANEPSGRANPVESSLRNAANQIASRMNQQRSQKMQASSQSRASSQQSNSNQSKQAASSTGSMSEDQRTNFDSYFLPHRDSETKGDWGKLRRQAAEQNLEGSREAFDPDFDQAIQAYFRTLQTEGVK
ncbi:MAG: hypothetical protein MUC43_05905 [Pirellula sp.]|nr:hypothetical protein [Pirellula sp.]